MAQNFTRDEEDEIFQCAICLENMLNRRPKALPCLHTFCADCIKNLISPYNIAKCPVCRKKSEVIGGAESLPDNFYLKSLAEHETPKSCIRCDKTISSKEEDCCSHCQIDMCEANLRVRCQELQSNFELKKKPDRARCRQHQSDFIQQYCVHCQELLCQRCVYDGTHSYHFTLNEQVYIDNSKTIQHKIDLILYYSEEIEKLIKESLKVTEGTENKAKLLKAKIDRDAEKIQEKARNDLEQLEEEASILTKFKSELQGMKDLNVMETRNNISEMQKIKEIDDFIYGMAESLALKETALLNYESNTGTLANTDMNVQITGSVSTLRTRRRVIPVIHDIQQFSSYSELKKQDIIQLFLVMAGLILVLSVQNLGAVVFVMLLVFIHAIYKLAVLIVEWPNNNN